MHRAVLKTIELTTKHSIFGGYFSKVQNQHYMSLTKEQKIELNKLETFYERIVEISRFTGMNPDYLISEFSFKFMDISDLNYQKLRSKQQSMRLIIHA